MQWLFAGTVFMASWLLWSGLYTPLLNGLGLLSSVLVLLLARRSGFFDPGVYSLHLATRLPAYWFWLAGQIVKANLVVARIVLTPRMSISPTLVEVQASELPPVGQAILGNAITLTPATVSFDVNEGIIYVHCLTESSAEELREGEMVRRAKKLMGN